MRASEPDPDLYDCVVSAWAVSGALQLHGFCTPMHANSRFVPRAGAVYRGALPTIGEVSD
jgi:hypothetical protein